MTNNKSNGLWLSENQFVSFSEMENIFSGKQIATRSNSAEFFTSLFSVLPDPDQILRKAGNAVETYNKMTFDPHIYSESVKRKALTTSLSINFVRGRASEKYTNLLKDYLMSNDQELVKKLRNNNSDNEDYEDADINDLIEIGLDAPLHGYQPVENVMGSIGTMKLPVKLIDRPRKWFHFDTDNRLRFKSKTNPVEGELMPKYSILLFQHKPRYDNPYGERVLSRCFWAWMFKHSTEKWKIQFLEKFASVWPIGKLPRGRDPKEYDELYDMLVDMINNGVAVIPDDGSVELKEPVGKGATANVFDGNINLYNGEISKAILTVTSLTSSGDKGSYASDLVRERMVRALAVADKKIIEKKLTQLIGWIFEINSWGAAPHAELWEPEDYDKERADRDKVIFDSGVGFTEQYFLKNYSFEKGDIVIKDSSAIPATTEPPVQLAEAELKTEVDELNKLIKSVYPLMDNAVEPLRNKIQNIFDEAENYAEAMENVQTLLPKVSTDEIENIVAKLNYIAFLKGSADAMKETK